MLDRHSEIIAHFIGQFDQAAEQSKLRLDYDAFRAQIRPDDTQGALLNVNVRIKSDLSPDKHIAAPVRWTDVEVTPSRDPLPLHLSVEDIDPVLPTLPVTDVMPFQRVLVEDVAVPAAAPQVTSVTPQTPIFEISPPGSIAQFIYQQNIGTDNDQLLMRPLELSDALAATRTDAVFDAQLDTLAAVADTLMPGTFTLAREYSETGTRIEELREAHDSFDASAVPNGASVTQVSQSEGTLPDTGLLIDGAAADEIPSTLKDELDARGWNKTEDKKETETKTEDTGKETAESGPKETGSLGQPASAGTDGVITASVTLGPNGEGFEDSTRVIETGGNLLINQAESGLYNVDATVIAVAGDAVSFTQITQVNVAQDRDTIVGADDHMCTGADHPFGSDATQGHNVAKVTWEGSAKADSDYSGGPLGFALTEIEGDLVLKTHVVQINLITDNDVVTYQTTFHSVELSTGGNISSNVLEQLGLEKSFDMILVGGDMQSLVSISQMNVLMDNDLLVDKDGVAGDVETADNVLWNQAEVTWHGVDTMTEEVSDAASSALDTMAGGQLDLDTLKTETLLDGKVVPLVLTVSGDLVFDYRVEQINILADADTVQLFGEAAYENGFTKVEVETGDNLLANVVDLDIHGTDSTIMAEGDVYSDLVIHQAGMYDTDETPLDLSDTGDLASEAVAFLAEGMIDEAPGGEIGGGDVIVDTGGSSGTFDTLGGVVA